ncbi:MAG: hypothetical protein ABIG44_16590 [Planctomycetota bacterium]
MSDDIHEYGHSFLPAPDFPKKKWERHVATEFCKAYQKKFEVSATFVEVGEDPPDVIIAVDGKKVAVELVGYRQRDEHHEVELAETRLKERLSHALQASGLHPYEIDISWKGEPRKKRHLGMTGRRTFVPRTDDNVQSFVDEFIQLVEHVKQNREFDGKVILFRRKPLLPGGPTTHMGYAAILASDFPTLARFCNEVCIAQWTHWSKPPMTSSLDARGVGLDRQQLERVVCEKTEKIRPYRDRACGIPLWLVVHSDWFPTCTRLPESDRPEAIKIIRDIVTNSPDRFDAVWWAEYTGSVDATEIWQVTSHAQYLL